MYRSVICKDRSIRATASRHARCSSRQLENSARTGNTYGPSGDPLSIASAPPAASICFWRESVDIGASFKNKSHSIQVSSQRYLELARRAEVRHLRLRRVTGQAVAGHVREVVLVQKVGPFERQLPPVVLVAIGHPEVGQPIGRDAIQRVLLGRAVLIGDVAPVDA